MRYISIMMILLLTGCITTDNAKLVGNEGQVYTTGVVNQKVNGDGVNVSVWNIWKAKDGIPLAQQYCEKFGKTLSDEMSFSGITGYYRCEGLSSEDIDAIFETVEVKNSIFELSSCIRENVVFLDDLTSDAETISKAVAQTCDKNWVVLADEYINALPKSSSLNKEYKNTIRSAFNENKVDKIIPYVLTWRSMIKKGWDEKQRPSEDMMPDSLFPKGI